MKISEYKDFVRQKELFNQYMESQIKSEKRGLNKSRRYRNMKRSNK